MGGGNRRVIEERNNNTKMVYTDREKYIEGGKKKGWSVGEIRLQSCPGGPSFGPIATPPGFCAGCYRCHNDENC